MYFKNNNISFFTSCTAEFIFPTKKSLCSNEYDNEYGNTYIHIYIYVCIYTYIYTYTYMQLWKQCALPVITTMAFWQLMHLGTWWPLIYTYMYIYFIYIYFYIIYICSICLSISLDLKCVQEFDSSYVKYTCIYIYIYIYMHVCFTYELPNSWSSINLVYRVEIFTCKCNAILKRSLLFNRDEISVRFNELKYQPGFKISI